MTTPEDIAEGDKITADDLNAFRDIGYTVSMNAGETINGATLPVPVFADATALEWLACDANDTARLAFHGFAISNSTNGNSIQVQTSGIVDGFSGLTVGAKYYVQDAIGTIGTTKGKYEIYVGVAISATQILIDRREGIEILRGGTSMIGTGAGEYNHTGDTSWTDVDPTNLALTLSPLKKGFHIFMHFISDFSQSSGSGEWRLYDVTNAVTLWSVSDATQAEVEREEELIYVPATSPATIKLQFNPSGAAGNTVKVKNTGVISPDRPAVLILPL